MERPVELRFEPHCSPCYNFRSESGAMEKLTTWVVPRVVSVEGNKYLITWRCNLGESCKCKECLYSFPEKTL